MGRKEQGARRSEEEEAVRTEEWGGGGSDVGPWVMRFFLNGKNEGFSSCMSSGRPRNITEM